MPVGTLTADEYHALLTAAGFATTNITRTHPITGGLYAVIVHASTHQRRHRPDGVGNQRAGDVPTVG